MFEKKNKKIILIDRDGIINKRAPLNEYINSWDDFEWLSETYDLMKTLSLRGFEFIIITNQAGIAKGKTTLANLKKIHNNMREKFNNSKISILDIYFCPHHPNDDCSCRKPKPGMIIKASKDWSLRLDKTIYIGDDVRDCITAYNANCYGIFIGDQKELEKLSISEKPLFACKNISEILPIIEEFYAGNIDNTSNKL
tara:strand:- start:253 stop:843 length:591 start_codon:yes stop_codon:yes gene_type:complete